MINGIISNYKILKQIGSGGMGMVYLAQHTTLERYAAVKVLNPEYSGNQFFKERFLNEATTLAKLNHPNIVSLYDFIEYEGRLLIIMEYVEGNTLDDFIKQNAYHDEKFVISVVSQILDGLSYAHRQNVVHRDIKPSNIIIGENDVSKILDFGIAKLTQSNAKLTKTGTRMGSVSYMSPEQILGKKRIQGQIFILWG
ncbi:MAG: serine/threonine protein kinase [Ignavibacteria bacterium]|nr:serine/threonine protein kinase [Ignavibacteria bacterium]